MINKPAGANGRFPMGGLDPHERNAILSMETDTLKDQYEYHCHRLAMGGLLAKKLDVPVYKNYASGGMSMEGIYTRILQHRSEITDCSFVLLGITFPKRTTQFREKPEPDDMIWRNHYRHVWDSDNHLKYMELNLTFGDDELAGYISSLAKLRGMCSMLDEIGCMYIVVDPLNIYRSNVDLNDLILPNWWFDNQLRRKLERLECNNELYHIDLIDAVQAEFDRITLDYTLNHALVNVEQETPISHCAAGHPNHLIHENFVEKYLYPAVKNSKKVDNI
jgi:hypothetical protein